MQNSLDEHLQKLFSVSAIGKHLDMADEASRLMRGQANVEIAGVREDLRIIDDIKIHDITVLNQEGAKKVGKPMGHYITMELPASCNYTEIIDDASGVVAEVLRPLLPAVRSNGILLIGLGNEHATPDSLGPKVAHMTMATRHLFQYESNICQGLQPLCTLATGVLGTTGIETAEIIKGVVQHVKPDAIIAIDALSSASIKRVGTTIQISDTGIAPGGGVGNKRTAINKKTVGVPVIAIGVPTVVNTLVIIYEALTILQQKWQGQGFINLPPVKEETLIEVSQQLLDIFGGSLMVTPKEIDRLINDMSKILAAAIAQSVHPGVDKKNYHLYLN